MTVSTATPELIASLIEGIVEEPLWSGFLDQLRHRLNAGYVSIVFRPLPLGTPDNRLIHLYSGRAWSDEVNREFRDRQRGDDPMPYHDLQEGRVYQLDELLRVGHPPHDFYRDRFLQPSGMNVIRMLRVQEAGGVSAWLSISRESEEFSPQEDALITELGPYLRAALQSYVALERERMTALVAHEAIRRMSFGWITLDRSGRILDSDAHASEMLSSADLLHKTRDNRLAAREPEITADIQRAIRELIDDERARPRAIVLSHEPWLDMLLVPSHFAADSTLATPALVAYVHADNWSSADRCDQLSQMFDLIPSEARLALALARGMTIAEAAGDLGLTVESARTYSKRIYAKTGARGQVDLVRFMHRSVLAIA